MLHSLGAKTLGVVVNAVEKNAAPSYSDGYAYGYGAVYSDTDDESVGHGDSHNNGKAHLVH